MQTYIPGRDERIKIHGRTTKRLPLTLFWTYSGIELITDASELHIELECGFETHEEWVRVEVNGYSSVRMPLEPGVTDICVFRGMEKREKKRVRLIKEVQPIGADPDSYLKVLSVKTDGGLYEVPEKPYKLEFIGDSITSGEGLGGNPGIHEWVPSIFTTEGNYAVITAENLGAEAELISQSGWGVYCSWDNNTEHTLPKIYDRVCGPQRGGEAERLGSRESYGFDGRMPDALIINLGTNDAGAFSSPAWTDPETGKTHKMRVGEDGAFEPEDLGKISDAVKAFLKKLRAIHTKARIVWCYGMLGDELAGCLEGAVNEYAAETGDNRVYYCTLPESKREWLAANEHPGRAAHAAAAETLTRYLRELGIGK